MTADRSRRIEELFVEAAECTAEERRVFLERACAGDPTLRAEVEALLAADREADGFLDRSAWGEELDAGNGVGAWAEGAGEVERRVEVGPYRLLRQLGEGGMGTVYLAVRSDNEYRQRVALKVVRPAIAGAERLERFRVERQILASLDHPNVARLLDGGTTPEGVPYLVMEHVDGEPIDRFCDLRELSIDRRLELFRKVCAAVHYAHRNLIVHRDLKPSNVLVTAAGEPKLLDFGVAKLLDPAPPGLEPGAEALLDTGPWGHCLTPAYASPEQLRGEPVTVASDVYSLGMVLCELLSGRLPASGRGRRDAADPTCDALPPSELVSRPEAGSAAGRGATIPARELAAARGLTPGHLRRRLAGDLDRIVLRACHRDPERRYPSAWVLAEELDRHRAGLPIYARRGTFSYRASKFLHRHRWGVAMTTLVLFLILASASVIAHQATQIARERDRFRAERDAKTQVLEFVEGLLQASDPRRGSMEDPSVREVLDQGVAEAEELRGQPLLKATLLDTLGGLHGSWGRYERAEELVREGLDLRRRHAGEGSAEVAGSLDSLGSIRWFRGDFEGAARLFRQALALRERHLGPEHRDVAETLGNLAVALRDLGEHEEAEKLDRRALAVRRLLLGDGHPAVVESLGNLVGALLYRGDLEGAEVLSKEVIELRRRIYRADHPYLAVALNNHAAILRDQGRYEEAEEYYRQALEVWQKSLGEGHHNVATAQSNLAKLLLRLERDREAEELFRRAREIFDQALGPGHWRAADCRLGVATIELRRGRLEAAEEAAREARASYRESLSPENLRVAIAESLLGEILLRRGRVGEAAPLLEESFEQILRETGEESLQSRRAKERLERLWRASPTSPGTKKVPGAKPPAPSVGNGEGRYSAGDSARTPAGSSAAGSGSAEVSGTVSAVVSAEIAVAASIPKVSPSWGPSLWNWPSPQWRNSHSPHSPTWPSSQ